MSMIARGRRSQRVNHAIKQQDPKLTEDPTPLMQFLLAILTSLMAPVLTDPALARQAAAQAIAAYNASTDRDRMTVTQITAFAITALDALRLSTPPDLSLSMKLKLRGNANALNRSAANAQKQLDQPVQSPPDRAEQAALAAEPTTPPASSDWATAMKTVATRLNAAHATPAQRSVNTLWAETLTTVAATITPEKPTTTSKAELLRSTLLSSGPTFPAHLGKTEPTQPAVRTRPPSP